MNIVMLTNTFTPHVGGVARSVESFAEEYRKRGHRVLVVAPEFSDMPLEEVDVVRVPAIQNFNASDFSVALPVPSRLAETLDDFRPDIVHSQHPFLLGMTAVRIARYRQLPLVFTHHTLYEQYTHYVPGDSPALKRFVIELATRYANLCDQVFAPSESIRDLL
ncbi:MAG: glycosyltransferase, partial [Proteobacteria bacterium]|nr:glycosyltransferase [Pseudomonadota bacterium]